MLHLLSPSLERNLHWEIVLSFEEYVPEPNALSLAIEALHTLEESLSPVVEERSTSAGIDSALDHVVDSGVLIEEGHGARVPLPEVKLSEVLARVHADVKTATHRGLLLRDVRGEVLNLLERRSTSAGGDFVKRANHELAG